MKHVPWWGWTLGLLAISMAVGLGASRWLVSNPSDPLRQTFCGLCFGLTLIPLVALQAVLRGTRRRREAARAEAAASASTETAMEWTAAMSALKPHLVQAYQAEPASLRRLVASSERLKHLVPKVRWDRALEFAVDDLLERIEADGEAAIDAALLDELGDDRPLMRDRLRAAVGPHLDPPLRAASDLASDPAAR